MPLPSSWLRPLVLALALMLISGARLARGLDVSLAFYTSIDCKTASSMTPNAALNLSTCVVTPGLVSLHYTTVACAGGGSVYPYFFDDTSCGHLASNYYKTGSGFHCLSDYASGSVAAFMLSCNSEESLEVPQETTTISVGPVATGAAAATSGRKSSTSTTTSSRAGGPSSSSSGDSGSGPADDVHGGWNSLSSGAHIGIYVAAGVFAVIFIIVAALCVWRRWPQHRVPGGTPGQIGGAPTTGTIGGSGGTATYYQHGFTTGITSSSSPAQYPALPAAPSLDAYWQVLDNVACTARQRAAFELSGGGVSVPALPQQVVSAAFTRADDDWKHKLGAAGEFYMFEFLQSLGLPNFGRQNWTSSLRDRVSRYLSMDGARDGIADLEYFDEYGAFTDFLLSRGSVGRGIQRGMRPVYRFEVKATTKPDPRTPFYMSDNQERHIRDALITDTQTRQVYIICRIFNLGGGSQTGLSIFLDPQAMRNQGRLQFSPSVSQGETSWMVQPV